jgi:hypothetical protein
LYHQLTRREVLHLKKNLLSYSSPVELYGLPLNLDERKTFPKEWNDKELHHSTYTQMNGFFIKINHIVGNANVSSMQLCSTASCQTAAEK